MSLFPAYSNAPSTSKENQQNTLEEASPWLENSSYIEIPQNVFSQKSDDKASDSKDDSSEVSRDCKQEKLNEDVIKRTKKEKKKKQKKKSKRKHKHEKLCFDGSEDFYVDKNPSIGYLTAKTLHWPACPKYRSSYFSLGYPHNRKEKTKIIRYFNKFNLNENNSDSGNSCVNSSMEDQILNEQEYSSKLKEINRKISLNLKDIDLWIEYVKHQDRAPIKSTKTQLAERKLEIIERALIHNYGNERLYELYIEICNMTFPSFEVTKMLDVLLSKDPTNYILWSAQILTTQGSMARCVVPDVLKLYEECMQKMYKKSKQDEIMINLFTSCALFLRQSGLNERFFALIKLALELNISTDDKLEKFQLSDNDQQTLIDYEEVILKSGLPMNEIWLRIEKLRQNYYFLPLSQNTINCSDPQRIVFNEDVCFFIYPLSQKENCFSLIINILRLLKIPFLIPSSLKNQFLFKLKNLNEFDAVEEILAVCLYQTISFSIDGKDSNFNQILYELVKEISSGPSFISSNVGYEIYFKTISDILLTCADCYTENERKRTVIMLIWIRFERIKLIIEKYTEKLTQEMVKKIKTRIKNVLKKDKNRNILNFYTEYALIEYEFGNFNVSENIFLTSIKEVCSSITHKSDLCHAYVIYAEILMKHSDYTKALKILVCYATGIPLEEFNDEMLTETRKLTTLKRLTENLNDLIFIEKNVQIMELEQFFLPDYFVSLLKAKIYCQILLGNKLEAMAYIENILRYFTDKNSRHLFIREMIFEFYVKILQMPDKTCLVSNLLIYETISKGLHEFPDNLFMLHTFSTLDGQPWYKIRSLLMKINSPIAVIFLIISARYRYEKFVESNSNVTYKIRVTNILKEIIDKNCPLRKNSLMWRLFLRSLCDVQESFEKCKNYLFAALDECPWNKALYLDGSVVVPQELSQLQDLMIEKQLRMYALAEELEILRNDKFEAF